MELLKEIRTIKDNYYGGKISIMDGLDFSQYETIRMTEFYTNSTYLEGNKEGNKIKPFYNIVNFRVNIATKATDIDTKDIQVFSDNPSDRVKSMLFNKAVKNWMRKTFFSKTLNDINFTRCKYGGVLIKRLKKDGELYLEVPEWKNLITDPVDIRNGVIIEKHYLTPVEIQAKKGVWSELEENWGQVEKVLEKSYGKSATNSSRLCIYEVEGQFEKDGEYILQRHFILTDKNENPVCILDSIDKKETDYKYLEWLKASGRALGIGVVEDGFNAQIETNDAILKNKELMEIASKIWYWTDSDVLENNMLEDTKNGNIFKLQKGDSLSQINNVPGTLPELTRMMEKWDEQYSRVSSTFEAITGETMPSGTPYRAVAIQNQEAQSTFNYRKEEFGIFLNEIFTDWVLPHIKQKMSKEQILTSDFEQDELEMIDDAFVKHEAKAKVKELILNGKVVTKEEYETFIESYKELINKKLKRRRYIDIPEGYFKDVEFKLDILTTGEQVNKSAVFETLSNIMVTVASNPQILQDNNLKKIFEKIIELSGVGITFDYTSQPTPQTTEQLNPVVEEAGEAK